MTDLAADLELLREAALESGRIALAHRKRGLKIRSKPGGSPVTNADLAVDAFLTERLRAARPDYGWLSEETADNADRLAARRVLVVDPIDGTTAFMKNRPWFSVALAVVEDERPVVGVVYAPALDETYEAAVGSGARLNGQPISPSRAVTLRNCAMLGDPAQFGGAAGRRCGWSGAIPSPTAWRWSRLARSTRPTRPRPSGTGMSPRGRHRVGGRRARDRPPGPTLSLQSAGPAPARPACAAPGVHAQLVAKQAQAA
jgi:hypothetical protein